MISNFCMVVKLCNFVPARAMLLMEMDHSEVYRKKASQAKHKKRRAQTKKAPEKIPGLYNLLSTKKMASPRGFEPLSPA